MNNKIQYTNRILPTSDEPVGQTCPYPNSQIEANKVLQDDGRTSSRTRHAVIRDNLRDGIRFLMEQDRLLAFAGQLLDELRSLTGSAEPDDVLRSQILLQGLRDIPDTRYKKVLLFGDGAHSPLKIHVLENGERKAVEIEQANLKQPGFQCVLQCGSSASDSIFHFSSQLAASAIAEILNLRFRNYQQKQRLEEEFRLAEHKVERAETSQRRLFENLSKPQPDAESNGLLSRVSETVAGQVGHILEALKISRPADPLWEEIPH